MRQKLIISENERSIILNMHKNAIKKNYLREQVTTNTTTLAGIPIDGKTVNPTVMAIQKKLNEKNKTTPGWVPLIEDGKFGEKTVKALYGAIPKKAATATATASSASGTTFYIDGKPMTLNTDAEINDMVNTKKITLDTFVFKSPEIQTPTKIKDLKDDNPIKISMTAIINKVAPELAAETKPFKISMTGTQADMKDMTAEQVIAAIKDKTLTDKAYVVNAAGQFEPVMKNIELAKIIQTAMGPANVTPEIKPTGNAELDTWLKGPIGSAWNKLTDQKQKESMFDSFEKTDPTIVSLKNSLGKGPLRSLVGMSADTKLGRGIQNLRGKVGAAITGNQPVV
jgi:peptidoglycan hydrolase-like protein with peptidoglycan-binding domain